MAQKPSLSSDIYGRYITLGLMCGTYNNNDNNKLLNEMQETILILHNAVETFVSSFFHTQVK